MEEIDVNIHPPENTKDPSRNIAFLVDNIKEIFEETYDENEKIQTVPVNLKRKEKQDLGNDNTESNVVKAIAKLVDKQSSTEKETIDTNKIQKISNPFEDVENIEIIYGNNPAQTIKEPDSETSTLLYRSTFSPNPSEESYFKNRPTQLSEFSNIPVSSSIKIPLLPLYINSNESVVNFDDNFSALPFLARKSFEIVSALQSNTTAKDLMFLSGLEADSRVSRTTFQKMNDMMLKTTCKPEYFTCNFDTDSPEVVAAKRSCIHCNNVAVDGCSDPQNKLIPSTVCNSEEDVCYSMHTPFGIVDRGCYNSSNNMSTHVCGSNLCNYIDIMDLPVMFASKQEWIQNMLDLTHFKRLRMSTMQDLMCLDCEGKNTTDDAFYYNNCLEGNLGAVQKVKCKENEICGIKSIKSKGYVWRGCVSDPLYNYYITLCDSDLCNYDPTASPYDSY
ncbi:hypothetical protein O0L34_g9283 [Tuta absoluta]|nr:hypothetical protein O0L34_g9283 [Tuta absoluta]